MWSFSEILSVVDGIRCMKVVTPCFTESLVSSWLGRRTVTSLTASQLLHCQGVLKLMNAYMRPMWEHLRFYLSMGLAILKRPKQYLSEWRLDDVMQQNEQKWVSSSAWPVCSVTTVSPTRISRFLFLWFLRSKWLILWWKFTKNLRYYIYHIIYYAQ